MGPSHAQLPQVAHNYNSSLRKSEPGPSYSQESSSSYHPAPFVFSPPARTGSLGAKDIKPKPLLINPVEVQLLGSILTQMALSGCTAMLRFQTSLVILIKQKLSGQIELISFYLSWMTIMTTSVTETGS
jgi:hypothetical protein